MLFGLFYSVNAKGNWTNLAKKNLQPGAKSVQYLGYRIIIKTF